MATPTQPCAAGVYTSPILLPFVAHLLESFGAIHRLQGFVSDFGRAFYKRAPGTNARQVVIRKRGAVKIKGAWSLGSDCITPFWAGKEIGWEISDVSLHLMETGVSDAPTRLTH